MGVPAGLLHVVSGGIDVDLFSPAPAAPPRRAGPPVLGLAGYLKRIKGIDVAIAMLPLLSGAGAGAELRIIGDGPEEERLRRLAAGSGAGDRIRFTSAVPVEEMPDFYRGLDLYLQPSIEIRDDASGIPLAESMGRALCEAQSCGVPVIASRSGGIPDVVRDGTTGRLVPPGDPATLAAAVDAALADRERLAAWGMAGRRLAVETMSWEAVIDATERHFEQAIARTVS
jgi:glycosyltransferase involved in cell wall biosynthesis